MTTYPVSQEKTMYILASTNRWNRNVSKWQANQLGKGKGKHTCTCLASIMALSNYHITFFLLMHASAHTNCPTGHKHHLCHSFLHHLLALSRVLTQPMTHSNTSLVLQVVSTKGNIHYHLMVTSRDTSLPPVHPSGRYKIDSTSEWRWRPSFCWSSLGWHTWLSSSTHKRHGISENGNTA